jgi:hypothetical protein
LAGILIPAVNGARESARRAQCIARQRDIVTAMTAYHTENNGLPGCVETVGKFVPQVPGSAPTELYDRHLPWIVMIYPHLGETKRYSALTQDILTANNRFDFTGIVPALEPISAGICPSAQTNVPLNYVVNCGPHALSGRNGAPLIDDVLPRFALFRDRRSIVKRTGDTPNGTFAVVSSGGVPDSLDLRIVNTKVKLDEIPDGTASTILLSENFEAGDWRNLPCTSITTATFSVSNVWFDTNVSRTPPADNNVFTRRSVELVNCFGFVWSNKPIKLATGSDWESAYVPNEIPLYTGSGTPADILIPPTARPSSKHRSTFITAFADGSVKPLDVGINPNVYLQYVCPDDTQARKTVAEGGLGYGN